MRKRRKRGKTITYDGSEITLKIDDVVIGCAKEVTLRVDKEPGEPAKESDGWVNPWNKTVEGTFTPHKEIEWNPKNLVIGKQTGPFEMTFTNFGPIEDN